jgi:predicted  nucleic acid-binding Zn-ribbon protein
VGNHKKEEGKSKPPEDRKSVPSVRIGEKTPDALKRYLGSVGVLIDKNASERAKEAAGGIKADIEEKLERHDSQYNRALGEAEEQKKSAEEAVEEVKAAKTEFENMKNSVEENNKTINDYKEKIEKIEKQREEEKEEREMEKAKAEGVIRGLQFVAAEAMYNANEILKQIGLIRKEQKGMNARFDSVEKEVGELIRETADAAIDSQTAVTAAKEAQGIARQADSNVDALTGTVNDVKRDVDRLSQAPPPSEEALAGTPEVATKPPAPVAIAELKKRLFEEEVSFSADEDENDEITKERDVPLPVAAMPALEGDDEKTKAAIREAVTKDAKGGPGPTVHPQEAAKPKLEVVGSEKKEYPKAMMEKAREHEKILGESGADLDEIVEATKEILGILGMKKTPYEPPVSFNENEQVSSLKRIKDEVAEKVAANLETVYARAAKIKGYEVAVAGVASRKGLIAERKKMEEKISEAKKTPRKYLLKRGDVNGAQAYTEAAIECQKKEMDAMAEVLGKVVEKMGEEQ